MHQCQRIAPMSCLGAPVRHGHICHDACSPGGPGSGRFRRVPVYAGVSPGGKFRKAHAGVGSGGGFSKVQSSGVCFLQVPEAGSGRFRTVPEGSGQFRCVPV